MENGRQQVVSGQRELMRSFVAIDISIEVKEQLSALLKHLDLNRNLNIKWVKPERMHLTLAFLGEVSFRFIEQAKVQLDEVARHFKPFICSLEGLGAFPNVSRARVLWVGMGAGEEEVKRVQEAVSKALVRIGYVPEKRQFSPHLTLARLRAPADVRFISGVSFKSSPFSISRVILFRSVLKSEGPDYSILAEFPFSG
ncbi:MAG: RNA 2',3'-cyclic phosphodiesterase [bacterium]